MKGIKELYNLAKTSGKKQDIENYEACVKDLFEHSPIDYISNIEYIISSDIGLKTLKEFYYNYGIPSIMFNDIKSYIENCLNKCELKNLDTKLYKESLEWINGLEQKYSYPIIMTEYYSNDVDISEYVKSYYTFTRGHQNSTIVDGMIRRFNEFAIPDAIITSNELNKTNLMCKYLDCYCNCSPFVYEWVVDIYESLGINNDYVESMRDKNLSCIVDPLKANSFESFRESVILEDDEEIYEYTKEDKDALEDMIYYREYQLTCQDRINIDHDALRDEIYNLYNEYGRCQEFENEEKEESDNAIYEITWTSNATDKKTGGAPKFLSANHDMATYGEDDGEVNDLEDLRRDSSNGSSSSSETLEDEMNTTEEENISKDKAVNNYYYYTYNNSMNKNTNSYNNDSSTHDDHSSKDSHNTVKNDYSKSNTQTSIDDRSRHIRNTNSPMNFNKDEKEFSQLESYEEEYISEGKFRNIVNGKNKTKGNFKDLPGKLKVKVEDTNEDLLKIMEDLAFESDDYRMSYSNQKKVKNYFKAMRNKRFFNKVGIAEIKKDGDTFKGEVSVVPSITKQVLDAHYGIDTNGNGTVIFVPHREDEEFIKQLNDIMDKAVREYKKDHEDENEELVLASIGYNGGSQLKSIVFRVTGDYARKLFYHIRGEEHMESVITELVTLDPFMEVGLDNVNDSRPQSDHPIKDTFQDIDRTLTKYYQGIKKGFQDIHNTGRAAIKPIRRVKTLSDHMINKWRDCNENNVREKLSDPKSRNALVTATKKAVVAGSLWKAGMLNVPVLLFLAVTKRSKNKKEQRIRNELISELLTEIKICDEKIKDIGGDKEHAADKYKLYRYRNELEKKLVRVGGSKNMIKSI